MFHHLLISLLVSSLTIAVIMLIKKVFRKQLSAKWQYRIWFFLPLSLLLPFIPRQFVDFNISYHLSSNQFVENANPSMDTRTRMSENNNWLQDLTISIQDSTPPYLDTMVGCIWIAGMAVLTIFMITAWYRTNRLQNSTQKLKNQEVLQLFEQCKQKLHISRKIHVGESPRIATPMMCGLFKPYVVLPPRIDTWLSLKEIQFIFLHELYHFKNKDNWTNYLMASFQVLYWFNPLIWIAVREMRLDREIACDHAVLQFLDEQSQTEYGNTIIHFVEREMQIRNFRFSSQLNGSKAQIKKRIEKIASFPADARMSKWNQMVIMILVGMLVACQMPLVSVLADDNQRYHFQAERTLYEDFSDYFAGYEGSFVLYDMKADQYQIYNKEKSIQRVSPDSTYKIFLSLFALSANAIDMNHSTIKWDGIRYPYESWNTDQNLKTAMKSSVNWYFQELDRRIPPDQRQAYLKRIGYGNTKLTGGTTPYWLESSLKISPVEQVQLLKAMYTNEWGFEEDHVQAVKDAIQVGEHGGKLLFGKTGTGTVNNENQNGWFIGYVEHKENTYFFATNIQEGENSNGSTAAKITLAILKEKGIY